MLEAGRCLKETARSYISIRRFPSICARKTSNFAQSWKRGIDDTKDAEGDGWGTCSDQPSLATGTEFLQCSFR
jgi:hypothetical protein